MRIRLIIILNIFIISISSAEILSQWRGPHRDGKYAETGLFKSWPSNGPNMLWSFDGLGAGHGSVAIAHERIYVTGMQDQNGVLYCLDMDGKLLWKKLYGPEWDGSYPGARTSPTIVDDLLYLESGQGVVFCFNALTGNLVWSVDLLKTFNAENIRWGMTESLLIDGDRVICTPGGPKHNVAALDRFTGNTIWTSPGNGDPAAYCSPILVEYQGTRLFVTMTSESIIGLDADSGEFYWAVPQHQNNKIHANTPIYHNGKIVCSSATSKDDLDGTVQLELLNKGKSVKVVWRNTEFPNLMGGVILQDGYLYGAEYRKSKWYCINWNTGDIEYINESFGGGVITWADGLFYCYAEKGNMGLVKASHESFTVISQFPVTLGTDQHWAHPVIHGGRLYIRHGNAILAYKIQ